MKHLIHCQRGATALEYGIFLCLAAIILSSGLSTVGERIGGTFSRAGAAMAAAPHAEQGGMGGVSDVNIRTIEVEVDNTTGNLLE